MEHTTQTQGDIKANAARIFQSMGFEVEENKTFAEYTVDIFLKKPKFFGSRCECWSCFFFTGDEKVTRETLDRLYPVSEAVQEEIDRRSACCDIPQTLIISEAGFSQDLKEAAEVYYMVLKTISDLENDLQAFYTRYQQLVCKSD